MIRAFLVAAALCLMPQAASAALTGTEITEGYFYPDVSTSYPFASYAPQSFTVGAGIESTVNVEGVTWIAVDFADNALTLDFKTILDNPTWTDTSFNGLIFSGAGIGSITGTTLASLTGLSGFDLSRVSISGNDLRVNLSGLSYHNGDLIGLGFTSAVPEPATWALMIMGFGLAGVAVRRRRSALTSPVIA